MNCLSISYRTADIEIRKQLSFDSAQKRSIMSALTADGGECVLLCTCNRTELYFGGAALDTAARLLTSYSGAEDLPEHLRIYEGENAYRHLFRVACGIDSMLIGEDEILRQVKEFGVQP